jgi:hypothetical protein
MSPIDESHRWVGVKFFMLQVYAMFINISLFLFPNLKSYATTMRELLLRRSAVRGSQVESLTVSFSIPLRYMGVSIAGRCVAGI